MRSLLLVAALLVPSAANAAALTAGFIGEALWTSKEVFFAGENVILFTVLSNTSTSDIAGKVVFFDGEASIGNEAVTLSKEGGASIVSLHVTPSAGAHTFAARFETTSGTSTVTRPATQTLALFVDSDADGDGVGNIKDLDDDNDGIPDAKDSDPFRVKTEVATGTLALLEKGKELLAETAPRAEQIAEGFYEQTEQIRQVIAESAKKKRDELAAEQKSKVLSGSQTGPLADKDGPGTFDRLIEQSSLIGASVAAGILDSPLLFYPVFGFLTLFLAYRFFRLAKRLKSGRPE